MGAMPPLSYSVAVLGTGFGLSLAGALLTDISRLLKAKTALRSIEDAFFRCFTGLAMATAYWSLHSQDPYIVYTITLSISVLKVKPAMVIEMVGKPLTTTASRAINELADRLVREAAERKRKAEAGEDEGKP